MNRGVLRVYLGAAPGVGKTYRMLDEGWRRRERGTDVVVAFVETHERPLTEAQLRDLEVVPRVTREYRGAALSEMDLDAVLARGPKVALVDELAHSNVPGGRYEKRWEDVEALLAAGIDVITTVNIQHLESVNDVVEAITGIAQHETVPDAFVRRADQIELVDMTPEALRRRLAHGNVYPADRIDASLANYFRAGNLGALRELALLWLADRVDEALARYREEHAIERAWETRERLVVGVVGGPADDGLLRRAARMAARTGAELVAAHVVGDDAETAGARDLEPARALTAELGGRFREIVDDDVVGALVDLARSERATQIVVGAGHGRSWRRPRGGFVERLVALSRDLDVHVIAHRGVATPPTSRRRRAPALPTRRWVLGATISLVALPLLTVALTSVRSSVSISTVYLAFLVVVLALASLGGVVVGVVAALAATVLENYYFIPPVHTLSVNRLDDVVALVGYLAFALGASLISVSIVRQSGEMRRARAEIRVLSQAALAVGTSFDVLEPLLATLASTLGATAVSLVATGGAPSEVVLAVGSPSGERARARIVRVDDRHDLAIEGVGQGSDDRELIAAFAGRIAVGIAVVDIAGQLAAAEDSLFQARRRGHLTHAVSAALSRRAAGARRALVMMRDGIGTDSVLTQRGRLELLDRSLADLEHVVKEFDGIASTESSARLTVGLTTLENVVTDALRIEGRDARVRADVAADVTIVTDPDVVAHAIAVCLRSALDVSGPLELVRLSAARFGSRVEITIIDRARSVRDDEDLAVAVAENLVASVGGQTRVEETPRGGRTTLIELPIEFRPGASDRVEPSTTSSPAAPRHLGTGSRGTEI